MPWDGYKGLRESCVEETEMLPLGPVLNGVRPGGKHGKTSPNRPGSAGAGTGWVPETEAVVSHPEETATSKPAATTGHCMKASSWFGKGPRIASTVLSNDNATPVHLGGPAQVQSADDTTRSAADEDQSRTARTGATTATTSTLLPASPARRTATSAAHTANSPPHRTTANSHSGSGHFQRHFRRNRMRPLAAADVSVSMASSAANSRSTRETAVSPGRARHLVAAAAAGAAGATPTIPCRADFGDHYPDGGWGWIVCGAAFTVHFLSQGIHLAVGTTLAEVVNAFGLLPDQAVWLSSSSLALSLLLTPLVVAVCRRKSPRLIAIVGGLITALGCLFLSFSTQLHQLFTSYTLVLGVGTSVTLTAACVIVGSYFHKRRECAEMLMLSGSGVGMALLSIFIRQTVAVLHWMRGLQALTGLVVPLIAAAALYRSAAIYHPRRRAILHIKNLRKTKKQQREFEDKPPYFDWSPLRMRSLQVLMLSAAMTSLGSFTPFVVLGLDAASSVRSNDLCLLMIFEGIAVAGGCLLFGLVVVRSSLRCMVARQYLCQLTSFGCGFCTLLLPLVSGFHGYAVYVWAYGILYGGYTYALKVYTYELASVKLSVRSWGYVGLSQAVPTLIGAPISHYMNVTLALPSRSGFLFSGVAMVTGSITLFLMPWASNHHSNHEVIQQAHFRTKSFADDTVLYGMDISDEISSRDCANNGPGVPASVADDAGASATASPGRKRLPWKRRPRVSKVQLYTSPALSLSGGAGPGTCAISGGAGGPSINPGPLGHIVEEENWSDIEAMSPMSPTDKVTEFLLQSQSMLETYGQLHRLRLPGVRLEINNEYADVDLAAGGTDDDRSADDDVRRLAGKPGIKDLKLEATISRGSPRRKGHISRVPRSRSEPEIWLKRADFPSSKVKITETRTHGGNPREVANRQRTTPV